MKINTNVLDSWLRHFKGGSALTLLTPAILEALKVIKPANFQYGLNKDTLVLVLAAFVMATIIVGYQIITKKRPEFAGVAGQVEQQALKQVEAIAAHEIAASPDPATLSQGVPGAGAVGSQAPPN